MALLGGSPLSGFEKSVPSRLYHDSYVEELAFYITKSRTLLILLYLWFEKSEIPGKTLLVDIFDS